MELGHQIGERVNGGFRFPLLLTHEEMASMTCTTRETVTRTLGQFRKDGWISVEDGMNGLDELRRSVEFLKRKRQQYYGEPGASAPRVG